MFAEVSLVEKGADYKFGDKNKQELRFSRDFIEGFEAGLLLIGEDRGRVDIYECTEPKE